MSMDLICFMLIAFVSVSTYWYSKRLYDHWENQNTPSVPHPNVIFGHMLSVILIKESVSEFVDRACKNSLSSVFGFYFMPRPGIIVRDPELVKNVLQINFSSFRDNFLTLSEKNDPVLVKNPFFTSDSNLWKKQRNRISNNLSGTKLKYLAGIVQEVCDRMSAFVERKILENGGKYECELKKFFTRYTGEVVANAAFAIKGQSFDDNPDPLSFTEVGRTLFEPSFIVCLKQVLRFLLPDIANFLGMAFLDKKIDNYMRQHIQEIVEKRQRKGDFPNEYLQFSVESSSGLDSIVADLITFFEDVYETSSTALVNLIYQLSLNLEIQSKLRDHIASVLRESNGHMTYKSLKNIKYLDQVIHESLRTSPSTGTYMKICTKEITLKGPDGVTCHLKPGNPVFIPTIGLQRDEKYWPNPEVFDPERFSPENQGNNNKYTFMPFGEGPRMGVGMHLGLVLLKHATATLITKFIIKHSSKTKVPLEIEPSAIEPFRFKGGLWAKFKNLN